jgi:hypothetical protein
MSKRTKDYFWHTTRAIISNTITEHWFDLQTKEEEAEICSSWKEGLRKILLILR